MAEKGLIRHDTLERTILRLRGHNVMLDAHLAALYGVPTKVLLQAVKRNMSRFPSDFIFHLEPAEVAILRSQTVTARSWGGRRTTPYAFTEHGVAMLASVLRNDRAVHVSVEIVRAFIRLRRTLESHGELARKLDGLEKKYDAQFAEVFDAIRELMTPTVSAGNRIGFGR